MIDEKVRFEQLLERLRCPSCRKAYRYEPLEQAGIGGIFGLLHCECRAWPVLDSIPILADRRVGAYEHTTATEESPGPTPDELVAMLRAGRGLEALRECLAIPVALPYRIRRLPLMRDLSRQPGFLALGRNLRRLQLRTILGHERQKAKYARNWLATFFGRWSPLHGDLFAYFFHRFCMPRYLAATEVMSLIPRTGKPVLDLACGFGHFAHFLTGSRVAESVVGGDFNFFPMWAARQTIAPEASFVFLDASQPLPFADGVFGAALCSDAFHLIPNKPGVLAEMHRTVDGGPLVFTRVGNHSTLPLEGEELTAAGYLELFGPGNTWLFSEDDLVRDYLSRHTPDLARHVDPESLAHEKYLSAVVWPEGAALPQPQRLAVWPHEIGRLQLNPLYRARRQRDGGVTVELRIPGNWFALQNARLTTYMPFFETISADAIAALHTGGGQTPEIRSLVDRFVLIGLPEHYAPDPLAITDPPATPHPA